MKRIMFEKGLALHREFCAANKLKPPTINESDVPRNFGTCAFYRPHQININVNACAHIGTAAQAWSFPGYVIDRTPYGVIQHEQGHAADYGKGGKTADRYFSDFSVKLRATSGEDKLTNYCPNDAEWFAEMFRLFVTNSDLLKRVRPRTYALLREHFKPVIDAPWRKILKGAPDRTIAQAAKKIEAVK